MIITCPQCAKKFNFKGEHIPAQGFKVRCSNCTHVWTIIVPSPSPEKKVEIQPDSIEKRLEPEPPPPPSKSLKEDDTGLRQPSENGPTFSQFIDDSPTEQKSFGQKLKLDWIVLFLGILIFLFIFMLDNFYQGSFFSNLTRDDHSYSVERRQAEKAERAEERDLPEYRPKNLPTHVYSD
jgi:predicted Zn finger-like uncharacterized protein